MRSYPYYPNHQLDIELGSTVQDRISGLTGVVTARVEYLTGCTQYGITPKGDGTKRGDTTYLDWQCLQVMEGAGALADLNTSATTRRGDGAGEAPGSRSDAPTR